MFTVVALSANGLVSRNQFFFATLPYQQRNISTTKTLFKTAACNERLSAYATTARKAQWHAGAMIYI